MKRTLQMADLGCAHCAVRMEEAIGKIDGVTDVRINFITQKLIIEAHESKIDQIVGNAIKLCKRIEPDCRIPV